MISPALIDSSRIQYGSPAYVGGTSATGSGGVFNLSLTNLTGGISNSVEPGDSIYVSQAVAYKDNGPWGFPGAELDFSLGYTLVGDTVSSAWENDVRLRLWHKVAGPSGEDLSVSTTSIPTAHSVSLSVHVFKPTESWAIEKQSAYSSVIRTNVIQPQSVQATRKDSLVLVSAATAYLDDFIISPGLGDTLNYSSFPELSKMTNNSHQSTYKITHAFGFMRKQGSKLIEFEPFSMLIDSSQCSSCSIVRRLSGN